MSLALAVTISLVACGKTGRSEASPGAAVSNATAAQGSLAPSAAPSAGARPDPGICQDICARSDSLHCKDGAECEEHCLAMQALPICNGEVRAALACFSRVALSDWECDAEGLPQVKKGFCGAEQAKVEACVRAASPP